MRMDAENQSEPKKRIDFRINPSGFERGTQSSRTAANLLAHGITNFYQAGEAKGRQITQNK